MREHIRFITKGILFIVPIILVIIFPVIILYKTGEFIKIEEIISLQSKNENSIVFGKVYLGQGGDLPHKMQVLAVRKPDVISVGSSRVLQFRSKLFLDESSFYNAGGVGANVGDFNKMLLIMQEEYDYTPKAVILGLDQFNFNSNRDSKSLAFTEEPDKSPAAELFIALRNVYFDLFKRKFSTIEIFSKNTNSFTPIGLHARTTGSGIRNDGSHRYGAHIENPNNPEHEDYQFQDTLKRIEAGSRLFEYGNNISQDALVQVQNLLTYAHANDIYVIAFLPPYPHPILEEMLSRGESYLYIQKIYPSLKPLFDEFEYALFDFTDLSSVGAGDDEIIDGLHASEKAYARILMRMAQEDEVLSIYAHDLSYLEDAINQSLSSIQVFAD
jgi:hypothetical protein